MPGPLPPALANAEIPPAILSVLRRLGDAGHRSWLVGGAVRDLLLGRAPHEDADFDLATPATPTEVTRLFRRTISRRWGTSAACWKCAASSARMTAGWTAPVSNHN